MHDIGSICPFGIRTQLNIVCFGLDLEKKSLENVVFFGWIPREGQIAHCAQNIPFLMVSLRYRVFWAHNCLMLPDVELPKTDYKTSSER